MNYYNNKVAAIKGSIIDDMTTLANGDEWDIAEVDVLDDGHTSCVNKVKGVDDGIVLLAATKTYREQVAYDRSRMMGMPVEDLIVICNHLEAAVAKKETQEFHHILRRLIPEASGTLGINDGLRIHDKDGREYEVFSITCTLDGVVILNVSGRTPDAIETRLTASDIELADLRRVTAYLRGEVLVNKIRLTSEQVDIVARLKQDLSEFAGAGGLLIFDEEHFQLLAINARQVEVLSPFDTTEEATITGISPYVILGRAFNGNTADGIPIRLKK